MQVARTSIADPTDKKNASFAEIQKIKLSSTNSIFGGIAGYGKCNFYLPSAYLFIFYFLSKNNNSIRERNQCIEAAS